MTSRPNRQILQPDAHWWHRFRMSSQKFAVMLTISAFVTGFGYVALTNVTSANGFALDRLERQVQELRASNEKLELQAADLRSLTAADRAGRALGLMATEKFDVLPATSGAVAVTTP